MAGPACRRRLLRRLPIRLRHHDAVWHCLVPHDRHRRRHLLAGRDGVFLRFWKPRKEWHFGRTPAEVQGGGSPRRAEATAAHRTSSRSPRRRGRGSGWRRTSAPRPERPLTAGRIILAWAPFAIMSLLLLLSGLLRQEEGHASAKNSAPSWWGRSRPRTPSRSRSWINR